MRRSYPVSRPRCRPKYRAISRSSTLPRMGRALRTAAVVLAAAWLAWNLYRHIAVYLIRGRVIVLTERVMGILLVPSGLLLIIAVPSLETIVTALVTLVAALAIRWTGLWVVVGAPRERIFERAGLVLRGMSYPFDVSGVRFIEERRGRIRISVLASLTSRTQLLRLHAARGIRKVALFRDNLRKFLLAIPRERR